MRITVTEQGALIPRELVQGVKEIEIRQEGDRLVIVPIFEIDPILGLGKNPISSGLTDASENHDQYLYRSAE